ncbi:hypothetical protein PSP6_140016 [Paraburkholderia tropica]|nr:hypothetical protein PSP6_140016 [Paraburkholderia tropica]
MSSLVMMNRFLLLKRNRKNALMQLYTHRVQPSNGDPEATLSVARPAPESSHLCARRGVEAARAV